MPMLNELTDSNVSEPSGAKRQTILRKICLP
jgi:hypothetical protein